MADAKDDQSAPSMMDTKDQVEDRANTDRGEAVEALEAAQLGDICSGSDLDNHKAGEDINHWINYGKHLL